MIEGKLLKVNTKIVALSLVAMAVVGGFGVELAYAESSSANASVTVANTISLTLTGGDLVIDNLTPGNASDSNVITASVTSNSPYGFHLSATTGTSGGTTSLVNTADGNFTFTSLDSNKATLANFSDNTWGYSYSENGSSWISGDYGFAATGYNGLPLDGNDDGDSGVVLFNSDSYLGSKSVQFKIGAKSATTQAAGTYTNTVNFYAVTNPEPPKTIATATTMQEVAPGADGCPGTLTTGQTYALIDSRDNTEYHVAKLADNNCWLLDNLALDLTNSTVLNGMDETNTHASNSTLGYLKGTTTRNPSTDPDGQYATAGVANWTSSNSYSAPLVNLSNKDVVPQGDDSMASQVLSGNWKVGGYYNFCAASAGSYCYGNGTDYGTSSGNATEDICPKGWRIPTGGSDGEYQALYNSGSYNSYVNYRSALHLPLSGYFDFGSASQEQFGGFWASTRDASNYMRHLYLSLNSVNAGGYGVYKRWYGLSVRCILVHS